MADEVFQIGFETTGDAEAAAAFEKLKIEQRQLQAQAKTLAAELKKLEAAGETSSTEFKELSRAYIQAKEAAGQLGREANGIASQLRNQAAAAEQSSASLGESRKASQNAGRQMGMLVNSVAELGFSFGAAIPGMQTYGTQLAMMGGNAVTFGAAMGPVGVAVGVLAGLLPVAIGALNQFGDASDDAAADQANLEVSTKDANDALRDQIQLLNTRERQARLAAPGGLVTGEDADAEQRRLQGQIDRSRAQLASVQRDVERAQAAAEEAESRRARAGTAAALREANEARAHVEALRRQQTAVEERLAAAREEQARVVAIGLDADRQDRLAAEEEEAERNEDRRRGRRQRLTEEEREAERKRLQAVRDASQAAVDAVAQEYERRAQIAQAHNRMLLAEERRRAQEEAEIQREVSETIREEMRLDEAEAQRAMRAAQGHAQEMAERQRQLGSITESMWSDIGGSVTKAAGDMFRFVISGAEGGADAFLALLDSFLEATSVQYTIKALAEAAEAVSAAARYDYAAAAQHGVAAGMAVAVAAATGIGAAAIPNVPTTESGAAAGNQPVQPAPAAQGAPQAPMNVFLYAPNTVMTRTEQAQQLAAIERVGQRELGRV